MRESPDESINDEAMIRDYDFMSSNAEKDEAKSAGTRQRDKLFLEKFGVTQTENE